MSESPKRPADKSKAEASRAVKPGRPTGETARAADSVPVATGPFTVLPMQFGRYRIEKLLGKGAMGAVYLAHDTQLDRSVALKVARVSSTGSAKAIQRMETEAKAAARIDHPLICKVYELGQVDGIRFIALQYIEGEDLKSFLRRVGRKRPLEDAVALILQLADALQAAQEERVIHRDLKPENIMLDHSGQPIIMDFGLARTIGSSNAGLTQGMIVGTAAYMSPEQAIGNPEGIDHRTDLYALGVMLFEMLTGEWPFTGTAIEVMGKKCVKEPPSPLSVNPDLPTGLAAVCHKMIAQKKEDRYASFADVSDALRSLSPTTSFAPRLSAEPTVELPAAADSWFSFQSPFNRSARPQFSIPTVPRRILIGAGLLAAVCAVVMVSLVGNQRRTIIPKSGAVVAGAKSSPGSSAPDSVVVPPVNPKETGSIKWETSKLVTEAVGETINLLKLVNLERDVIAGSFQITSTALIGSRNSRLYLPVKPPEDYQLKLAMRRLEGLNAVAIGFMMAGRQGVIALDGWNSAFSGLYVDGRDPRNNCTTRPGKLFTDQTIANVVLTVHPGHLHVTFEGKPIIDWYGDPERLYVQANEGVPSRESPFITLFDCKYVIESASLTPIKPEPTLVRPARFQQEVEVIPLVNVDRDSQGGVWSINGETLHSPNSWSKLYLPTATAEEYSLSATCELPAEHQGDYALTFGLVAGNSYFQMVSHSRGTGLDMLDGGTRWEWNETRLMEPIQKPGVGTRIVITVTKMGIRVENNGTTLVDWRGDPRRLSIPGDWALADARRLYIGSTNHFKIRDIRIGPPAVSTLHTVAPSLLVGKPIDLLSAIDTARDAIAGNWQRDGSSIRVMGNTLRAKLVVPIEPPDEYKLTLSVARELGGLSEKEAFVINLPIAKAKLTFVIDSHTGTISGTSLDDDDYTKPLTSDRGTLMPRGPVQDFVFLVRGTGLRVLNGNRTIVDWTGNPDRFVIRHDLQSPGRKITLLSWDSRFRIDKLELEPLPKSPESPVASLDSQGKLLPVIRPERDARKGEWKWEGDGLRCSPLSPSRLRIPVNVPERYVLSGRVERKRGTLDLLIGLVVGGHPCSIAIDGGDGVGLDLLDGMYFWDKLNSLNRRYPGKLLPLNQIISFRCLVLPDTIVVECGDKEVVRWHGDPRRLSGRPQFYPPNYSESDRSHLWLGGFQSEFVFRDLELKPLSNAEATALSKSFSGVFPTSIQANVPFKSLTVGSSLASTKTAPGSGGKTRQQSFANPESNWQIHGTQIAQTSQDGVALLVFGDPTWGDYNFSFEARTDAGTEFGMNYRHHEAGAADFVIGRYDGTWESTTSGENGQHARIKERKTQRLELGRWYKLEARLRGSRFQCFIDDQRVFEFDDPKNPRGAVGLWTWRTQATFRNIRVTDPAGKVLFEGLPALPPQNGVWPPSWSHSEGAGKK